MKPTKSQFENQLNKLMNAVEELAGAGESTDRQAVVKATQKYKKEKSNMDMMIGELF